MEGVVDGGAGKILCPVTYKTGLDDKVRLPESSGTGGDELVVVQAAVMKEEHRTGVVSCLCFGGVKLEVSLL